MQTTKSTSNKNRFGTQNQPRGARKGVVDRIDRKISHAPSDKAPLTASLGSLTGGALSSKNVKERLPSGKDTALMIGGIVAIGLLLEGARRLSSKVGSISGGSASKRHSAKKIPKADASGIFDKTGKGSKAGYGTKKFSTKSTDSASSARYKKNGKGRTSGKFASTRS